MVQNLHINSFVPKKTRENCEVEKSTKYFTHDISSVGQYLEVENANKIF